MLQLPVDLATESVVYDANRRKIGFGRTGTDPAPSEHHRRKRERG